MGYFQIDIVGEFYLTKTNIVTLPYQLSVSGNGAWVYVFPTANVVFMNTSNLGEKIVDYKNIPDDWQRMRNQVRKHYVRK